VAGGDAGFATGAAVERDLEGVLFSRARFGERDQAVVVRREIGSAVVDVREAGDGGLEGGLLGEEFVDECARLRVWGLLDRR